MKFSLKTALFILFSVALLLLALRNVRFSDLSDQFSRASYGWLFPVSLSIIATFGLRAARWRLALQALGYQPSLFHATVAVSAGNMASLIIPGAGELTRCGTLQRTDGVPMAQGIGSVVAERLVDLLMLLLLLLLTLLLEYQRLYRAFADLVLIRLQTIPIVYLIMAGLLGGLALIAVIWWVRRPGPDADPLAKPTLLQRFSEGLTGLKHLPNTTNYIILSFAIYGVSFLTMYFSGLAASQSLINPLIALSLLTIGSVGGLAVPTQGGIGTYHVLFALVLGLYGYSTTQSLAMATFIHAIIMGLSLIISGLSFLLIPFILDHRTVRSNV